MHIADVDSPDRTNCPTARPGRLTTRPGLGRYSGIVLFVVALLTLDFFYIRFIPDLSSFWQIALGGVLLGEVLLILVVAGCGGRLWLSGLIAALLLAMIAMVILIATFSLAREYELGMFLVLGLYSIPPCMPAFILGASAPLLAMRQLRGWKLTFDRAAPSAPKRSGLEDLFCFTAVVAACLTLTRFHTALFPHDNFVVQTLAVITASAAGACLLAVVPAMWVAFRTATWMSRLVLWLVVTAVACLILLAIAAVIDRNNWLEKAPYVLAATLTAALTVVAGFCVMLISGVELRGRRVRAGSAVASSSAVSTQADEADVKASSATARPSLWPQRALTLALVGIALMVNVWLGTREAQRLRRDERHRALAIELQQSGGGLRTQGQAVGELTLGRDADDSTLERFSQFTDVWKLSLADSQITDQGLKQLRKFPRLISLDLSGTQISDAALDTLRHLRLRSLSVARTNLSKRAMRDFFRGSDYSSIDVSQTGLTDDDLVGFELALNTNLSGNPITDAGLARVLSRHKLKPVPLRSSRTNPSGWSRTNFESLDLSNTDIDGSGVAKVIMHSLNLDGTKVTDAVLQGMLAKWPETFFSVKNTQISAAIFHGRPAAPLRLALGGCRITESDLANSGPLQFHRLSLSGPEFTGACFRGGQLSVTDLDLSHSSLSDESVQYLASMKNLRTLNLSHTNISDRALPSLAQLAAHQIDLRNTKITAAGLQNASFACLSVIISHSQFTAKELRKLRYALGDKLAVDGELQHWN